MFPEYRDLITRLKHNDRHFTQLFEGGLDDVHRVECNGRDRQHAGLHPAHIEQISDERGERCEALVCSLEQLIAIGGRQRIAGRT